MSTELPNNSNTSKHIDLSVVIVTYNCWPFVRLCLHSLLWQDDARLEVIVVDNNSDDATAQALADAFPQVTLIANKKNRGFGTACNQGMKIARGRYFLMLNPDTFVPEDLAQRVVAFMDAHAECGAMGVRIDVHFFLFGEDFVLSWRIHLAGFVNYYVADINIVHFKGESTAKDQRYVTMFYGAMELFYEKHFGTRQNGLIQLLVRSMIAALGLLSSVRRLLPSLKPADPIYPVKEDYFVLAGEGWSESCAPDALLTGRGKLMGDELLRHSVSVQTFLMDVTSFRP
jgi:GT2 family glycosyltransferase